MLKTLLNKLLVTYPRFLDRIKWLLSFKIISHNSLYKKYALRKARQQIARFKNSNVIVCIENTMRCNARCIMCLHRKGEMTDSMAMPLYKKTIDECAQNSIKRVSFGVYGEPLADPLFAERLEYLKNKNIECMVISNGSLMSDDLARKLLQYKYFKEIRFSINGFSKEVYEKVMVGLDRNETYHKIIHFLELRKILERQDVVVNISCIKTKYVYNELDELLAFWKKQDGINRVFLLDIRDRSGELTGKDGLGKRGVLDRDDLWFPPCNELWSYLSIYYDGKVAPCCMDNSERRFIIGDITHQSLGDILTGDTYTELRAMHQKDNRDKHEVCKDCHYPAFWY